MIVDGKDVTCYVSKLGQPCSCGAAAIGCVVFIPSGVNLKHIHHIGRLAFWLLHQRGNQQGQPHCNTDNGHQSNLYIEPLPDTAQNEEESNYNPESINFQGQWLPRYLCAEDNDANAEETCGPPEIRKQSNTYPDKKQAPPCGFESSFYQAPIRHALNAVTVDHNPLPYLLRLQKALRLGHRNPNYSSS